MNDRFSLNLLHPKHWLTWLLYGCMVVIVHLPHSARMSVGRAFGRLAERVAGKRRHIVDTNLRLCFPELASAERAALLTETFESGGMSIIESCTVWIRGGQGTSDRVVIHGLEHLESAKAKGSGVILMGSHMSTLDICGAALSLVAQVDVMYRANDNPVIDHIMHRGRSQLYPSAIERNDVKSVIRRLKAGHVVWYGPDQDYGIRNSVFAPFFNIPTATFRGTSRLAKITGATVVPFSHIRDETGQHYEVFISPEWQDFPSESAEEDAARVNAFIEQSIRRAPAQYWWFHRRFKTRPEGESDLY